MSKQKNRNIIIALCLSICRVLYSKTGEILAYNTYFIENRKKREELRIKRY
jgi:hypothetical protein